ncbi:MAG TPA: MOSC domain-containing protein, partial [Thermoanaerobaculia bacterium]|nr:MOSC domain-containing protein [Thermoanaerobaculia bacterium]
LEPTRLRANLFVEITEGRPFDEDRWIGQSIRIGEAHLEVTGGSSSSVLFFQGESGDADLLKGLASVHGHLGLDLRAVAGARVRVGDPVVLVG